MANENQQTENTQTTGEQNSADQMTSENQEQVSNTSTTATEADAGKDDEQAAADDSLDLGKKPDDAADDTTDDAETAKDQETDPGDKNDDGKDETAKLFGAPEEGTAYELTLDEGVELDAGLLEKVTPVARQLNLSNEGLSLLAKDVLPLVQQQAFSALEGDIVAQRATWETEARQAIAGQKPVVGADGKQVTEDGKPKFEPVVLKSESGRTLSFDNKPVKDVQRIAAKALDHLAPAGFRAWLDETGLGVHPMMVALAYNAGKNIAEETDFERTGGDADKPKAREDLYYKS